MSIQRSSDLSRALADARVDRDHPRLTFEVVLSGNPPTTGVRSMHVDVEDLPGDLVTVRVKLGTRPITTGDWFKYRSVTGGQLDSVRLVLRALPALADRHPLAADDRQEARLREAGWEYRLGYVRTWELDPGDRVAVGTIVDAISHALDVSQVPPDVIWEPSRAVAADEPNLHGTPPDEPWIEDATEEDLRVRLVRLAGLRGGRLMVRLAGGSVAVALTAMRRGTVIEVRGDSESPVENWKGRWTLPGEAPNIENVRADVEAFLRDSQPGGGDSRLAIRLELQAAIEAHNQSGYNFAVGWFAAVLAIVAVKALSSGLSSEAPDVGPLLIVAFMAFLPASAGLLAVDWLARRRNWRYSASELVAVLASIAASLAYVAGLDAVGIL